jgi:hypothetical protein
MVRKRSARQSVLQTRDIFSPCRYLQIPVAVIIANISRNYTRDKLVVSFLCLCRFLGYAFIPLVIKSSNTKSIEFFSSSSLTDKRIPAANKAMRIAPISHDIAMTRSVGNILDVAAPVRSLDRQAVTPSDRCATCPFTRAISRLLLAPCFDERCHGFTRASLSLRLPPARIVSALDPAPRSSRSTYVSPMHS